MSSSSAASTTASWGRVHCSAIIRELSISKMEIEKKKELERNFIIAADVGGVCCWTTTGTGKRKKRMGKGEIKG